jgi:hypothetical protein
MKGLGPGVGLDAIPDGVGQFGNVVKKGFKLKTPDGGGRIVDPGQAEEDDNDDKQDSHAGEEHDHVALALTREMARAGGGGFRGAVVVVIFHAPDGGLVNARRRFGRAARLELLLQQLPLLREEPLLFLELPPPLFEGIRVVAVFRHGWRLTEISGRVAWKVHPAVNDRFSCSGRQPHGPLLSDRGPNVGTPISG